MPQGWLPACRLETVIYRAMGGCKALGASEVGRRQRPAWEQLSYAMRGDKVKAAGLPTGSVE
jgi:hypothetical protein